MFGVAVLATFMSCGTIDQRVDPDAKDMVGGTALQSQDIRAMADQMARDIKARARLVAEDPSQRNALHILSLRNDSSQPIDREIILTAIRTKLFDAFEGRVAILDRSAEGIEAIRAEREAKRAGAVSANPNRAGAVKGSDFVLKGTIKDKTNQSSNLRSAYYIVTFELTDLETGELRWTDSYETKFVSEKSVISR